MNIELSHDPMRLSARRLFETNSAKALEAFLQRFIRTKFDRDYRLRVVPDYENNTVELQARWSYPLNLAVRAARDHGLSLTPLRWVDYSAQLERS